jgi:3-oxoacyl-[acyl-carrier protein] reductase
MRLQGRTAIITGAAGCIGAAIARRFATEGADLCLAGRRGCAAVMAELGATGRRIIDIRTDVANRGQNQRMVERTMDVFGRIDILVTVAGWFPRETPKRWQRRNGIA